MGKTKIPDGAYNGIWNGSVITLTYNEKIYDLKVPFRLPDKWINAKVLAEVQDGDVLFAKLSMCK